jgi:hypothetical protein
MLRRVLTAYLALLTVAAPCLCCCTTGRLLAAAGNPLAGRPAQPDPPATAAPCCCHDVDTPDEPQPAPQPKQPIPEQRCPCRDHSDKQAQVTVAPAITAELALLRTVFDAAPIALLELNPSVVLLNSLQPPEPFPSTDDLLQVHHRLRC